MVGGGIQIRGTGGLVEKKESSARGGTGEKKEEQREFAGIGARITLSSSHGKRL